MTQDCHPAKLGAVIDEQGTSFAVFSSIATRMQLCLFDSSGQQIDTCDLAQGDDGIWHGHVADCRHGQHYGYRAHGPHDASNGLHCNPAKLLIDPYARALAGRFEWNAAVFDTNDLDSAHYVPKSVVTRSLPAEKDQHRRTQWSESIFYEANVRGFTMRHPAVNESDRGTFDGMRNKEVLSYLKSLGITAIELLPVQAFIDEQHLYEQGLGNYWGYNSISFFAPSTRYSKHDAIAEFRDMVRSMHEAGIEVILDVAFNHTGEGGSQGPSICFRGLDNLAYYGTEPTAPGTYINDSGCGNTLNTDHPRVQQLVTGSLSYWHQVMGVDGFRFDLAPVLGRHDCGFSAEHPLLNAISNNANLSGAKLIAEPWDPGPGGYQLGAFPPTWAEWNDKYRDTVRQFWRNGGTSAGELAERMRGSADIFSASGRDATTSVNFITAHDGFTLTDLVSYEQRHNDANGENNHDGHSHNYSCNHGVEGATDDTAILAIRRQHRLTLMATLLFSQGTPMLLAGDEFSHSQRGNNNAYAQDNDLGWLDWKNLSTDPDFTDQVRQLIALRNKFPLLRLPDFLHGREETDDGVTEIHWLRPDGSAMSDQDWSIVRVFSILLTESSVDGSYSAVAIVINGSDVPCPVIVPVDRTGCGWHMQFASAADTKVADNAVSIPGQSIALLAVEET